MNRLIWAFSGTAVLLGAATVSQAQDAADIRRTASRIQFANYPPAALRRGEEGTVGIRITTDKRGRLMDCDVVKSSGFASLDQASCDFLLRYGSAKPFLSPDGQRVQKQQDGEVVWTLPEGHVRAPASARSMQKVSQTTDANKRICKVQPQLGSLVTGRRICMTSAEWQNQRSEAQRDTESMQPHFRSGQ